ncbi:hypothetical protein D3C71_2132950 [compost metagenome]
MLQLFGRGFALLIRFQRHKEADDDARQRRMDARFQYRGPQHHAHQNVDPGSAHVKQIQQRQHSDSARRHAQR